MTHDVIDVLAGWIGQHLEEELTIDVVAARSGYSKWHLQRAFKQQTGMTLGSYIRCRRLELAAQRLVSSNSTIMTIATDLGFSSQQCFQRVFKQHFRITPRHYRAASHTA